MILPKMLKNRKGYSIAMTWVFGLVSLFGLGILYIVYNQVFNVNLIPVIINQVNASTIDAATKLTIYGAIDKYMVFFNTLPFVIFFVVVVYMFVAAIRKEGVDVYR